MNNHDDWAGTPLSVHLCSIIMKPDLVNIFLFCLLSLDIPYKVGNHKQDSKCRYEGKLVGCIM